MTTQTECRNCGQPADETECPAGGGAAHLTYTLPTIHYHAGQNIAGYLPMDDDPSTFTSFDDAKRSLIADMLRDAENAETETIAENLTHEAEDLNLSSGPDFLTYVETIDSEHAIPMAYWVTACAETDCEQA